MILEGFRCGLGVLELLWEFRKGAGGWGAVFLFLFVRKAVLALILHKVGAEVCWLRGKGMSVFAVLSLGCDSVNEAVMLRRDLFRSLGTLRLFCWCLDAGLIWLEMLCWYLFFSGFCVSRFYRLDWHWGLLLASGEWLDFAEWAWFGWQIVRRSLRFNVFNDI